MGKFCSVYLCLLFINLCLLNVEGRKYKISKRLVCGASPDALLKSVLSISESACVDECGRRPLCKALDYSGRFKLCNLYRREDINLVKGHCIYLKRTDITSEVYSTCINTCMDGAVCDVTTNECMISECKPLTVENVSFWGNLNSLGSTKREICHNQFGNVTMPLAMKPLITCQANGTWNRAPSCEEPYNVALGKNVTLSTEYSQGRSIGSLMVNGDISGTWVLACTSWESKPWAVVDLGESHVIFALKIYNRRDCCPERLHDLEIYAGDSIDSLLLCTHYFGVLDAIVETIAVSDACFGRHVKVQIVRGNGDNILTICELEVYGIPVSSGTIHLSYQ